MPELTDLRPLLSGSVAQNVTDRAGGVAYGGEVEGSTNVAFGGPTADFILYGVVNGAFAQGPASPNDYIDPINNPLPYWTGPTQVSGGAIQCSWVVDASSPSGYNLRFTVNPGAASDEAYVEQIVPIGGARNRWIAEIVRVAVLRVTATDNGFQGYIAVRYLDSTGSVVGSAAESTPTPWSADAQLRATSVTANAVSGSLPPVASLLRIRIGIRRNAAAASASGTFDVPDVRIDRGVPYLAMPETDGGSPYGAAIATQSTGILTIGPDGAGGSSISINRATNAITLATSAAGATTAQGDMTINGATTLVGALGGVTASFTGKVTNGAAVVNSGIITASIGADQNNYSPGGGSTASGWVITATGANRTITGIDPTGWTAGQTFYLRVGATNSVLLADKSGSSTAGNRFSCPGAATVTVRNTGGVWIVYDPTNNVNNPFCVLAP